MLEQVQRTIQHYRMLNPARPVGVAVSGGADSVCLLHVLREFGYSVVILHLNHKLRGAESDEDERFVRQLGEQLGCPVHVRSVSIADAAGNLEALGRTVRREFFEQIIAEGIAERVATGHTRSDQVETVLYRLLRGAGTAGLSGILPVIKEGVVRPLIDCSREQVREYLRDRSIPWREDSTNTDREFVRNRIRHELIPVLVRDFNPALEEVLARTAAIARDEEEYWNQQIANAIPMTRHEGAVLLSAPDLLRLPLALARRVVRSIVGNADLLHVERILALARQTEGHGRLQLPGWDIFRSFEWLRFGPPRTGSREDRNFSAVVPLTPDGPSFCFHRICMEVHTLAKLPGPTEGYTQDSELDWDRLALPLELRNWYPGDTFTPQNGRPEKVKTLFQKARIPLWERQTWPILESGGTIVWTRGFGVAEGFERTDVTERVLRVKEIEAGRY